MSVVESLVWYVQFFHVADDAELIFRFFRTTLPENEEDVQSIVTVPTTGNGEPVIRASVLTSAAIENEPLMEDMRPPYGPTVIGSVEMYETMKSFAPFNVLFGV